MDMQVILGKHANHHNCACLHQGLPVLSPKILPICPKITAVKQIVEQYSVHIIGIKNANLNEAAV